MCSIISHAACSSLSQPRFLFLSPHFARLSAVGRGSRLAMHTYFTSADGCWHSRAGTTVPGGRRAHLSRVASVPRQFIIRSYRIYGTRVARRVRTTVDGADNGTRMMIHETDAFKVKMRVYCERRRARERGREVTGAVPSGDSDAGLLASRRVSHCPSRPPRSPLPGPPLLHSTRHSRRPVNEIY